MGNLLWTWVNACHVARSANVALDFNCQRSRATAHIQHLLCGLNAGRGGNVNEFFERVEVVILLSSRSVGYS
jgi:hypothetical protein